MKLSENIGRRLIKWFRSVAADQDLQQQQLTIEVAKPAESVNDFTEKLGEVLTKYCKNSQRKEGCTDRAAAANTFMFVCGWMLTVEPRFTLAELQDLVNEEIPKVLLALKVPEK